MQYMNNTQQNTQKVFKNKYANDMQKYANTYANYAKNILQYAKYAIYSR